MTNAQSTVVPFGKHKGRTVDEIAATDPAYLEWLAGQNWLAERFAAIHAAITAGGEIADTPEHNAIQARFLDLQFRVAFMLAADRAELERCMNPKRWDGSRWVAETDTAAEVLEHVAFEQRNIDVVMGPKDTAWFHAEIKPAMGDDYPAVMRQVGRNGVRYLLIDRYTGAGVPFNTVRAMFLANNVRLVMVAEVEAKMVEAAGLLKSEAPGG